MDFISNTCLQLIRLLVYRKKEIKIFIKCISEEAEIGQSAEIDLILILNKIWKCVQVII